MLRKNSLCIVTGGSSGIGLEICKQLLKEKHRVIIADLKRPKDILEVYSTAHFYEVDLTLPTHVHTNMKLNVKDFFHQVLLDHADFPELLINCAGIGAQQSIDSIEMPMIRDLIRVNFRSPILLSRLVAKLLMKNKMHGHIVNVSSGQVFFKLPTWGAYTASKAALAAASDAMHYELAPHNICVTTVYPFMVNTGFYDEIKKQDNTLGGHLAMKLLPWYSYSPRTVSNQILRAIQKHQREVMCSPANYVGKYMDLVPGLGTVVRKLANFALNKKEK